jgi:general secretion pathway protein G
MNTCKRGFTLVEILIVVIILGILASVIIPQISHATGDTRKAALSDQLHGVRVQIQLYTLQHGDSRPAIAGADWSPLTTQTTFNGTPCGPYLPDVPRNTINGFSDVAVVAADPSWGDAVVGANIGFVSNPISGTVWGTNTAGNRVYNEADPNDPNN